MLDVSISIDCEKYSLSYYFVYKKIIAHRLGWKDNCETETAKNSQEDEQEGIYFSRYLLGIELIRFCTARKV